MILRRLSEQGRKPSANYLKQLKSEPGLPAPEMAPDGAQVIELDEASMSSRGVPLATGSGGVSGRASQFLEFDVTRMPASVMADAVFLNRCVPWRRGSERSKR